MNTFNLTLETIKTKKICIGRDAREKMWRRFSQRCCPSSALEGGAPIELHQKGLDAPSLPAGGIFKESGLHQPPPTQRRFGLHWGGRCTHRAVPGTAWGSYGSMQIVAFGVAEVTVTTSPSPTGPPSGWKTGGTAVHLNGWGDVPARGGSAFCQCWLLPFSFFSRKLDA